MRLIKKEEKNYYNPLIATGESDKIIKILGKDFLYDILCILEVGEGVYKYIVNDKDIRVAVQSAYAEGTDLIMLEEENKFFQLKIDLLDFIGCAFFKELYNDSTLLLKEKFDTLLNILNSFLDQSEETEVDENFAGGSQGEEESQEIKAISKKDLSKFVGEVSEIFKGFSALFNYLKPPPRKNELYSYSSGKSFSARENYKEILQNKEFIKKIVDKLYTEQGLCIFNFANAMEMSFEHSGKTELKETRNPGSNLHFRKMQDYNDISSIIPSDLSSPLLDYKIMKKTARVKGYKNKTAENQNLYLLLDHSGSTDSLNRLLFIKSLAIAVGQKAWKDHSPLFLRWFDDKCDSLFVLKEEADWTHFLDYVLDKSPAGGTALELALKTAVQDVENAQIEDLKNVDLLLISDGTSDLNSYVTELLDKKKAGMKFHFVLLEEGREFTNIKRLAESVNIMDTSDIKEYTQFKPEFKTVI